MEVRVWPELWSCWIPWLGCEERVLVCTPGNKQVYSDFSQTNSKPDLTVALDIMEHEEKRIMILLIYCTITETDSIYVVCYIQWIK